MYYKPKELEQIVNTRGTKLWTMMNDNSKAKKHRDRFVSEHGGFFKQEGRFWVWVHPIDEKNGYWLKNIHTGEKVFFDNMLEFGKTHGLTSVKICELLNGKRKTYKGWTAVEIREVKDGVGSYEDHKKEKPKSIVIGKTAIFVDMNTNQLIQANNLSQFAKQNGYEYSSIKKLARGGCKTYKNLKLYNPLEAYKDSPEPK